MGSDHVAARILGVYDMAACGDSDAYEFLRLWHLWVHAIDDHVDGEVGGKEVIGLCADAAVLFASPFFWEHREALGPMVTVISQKYRVSVEEPRLDGLRFAGNDMVLLVASIKGGRRLVEMVSALLWPLVIETQL